MSASADATMLAIQRACAHKGIVSDDEVMDFAERFYTGEASEEECAAVAAEFQKFTRADIGRGPLSGGKEEVLTMTAERLLEDMKGAVRACCDCGEAFNGPGPRCLDCVAARNARL